MTKEELVAKVRLFLDEATEDFYSDDNDIYKALTDAQLEVANALAQSFVKNGRKKLPQAISPLIKEELGSISSGASEVAITGDPIIVLGCQYQFDAGITPATSPYAVAVEEDGEFGRMKQNPLLSDGVFYYWEIDLLKVHPVATATAGYTIRFIDTPVDITSAVEPEIGALAHDALVERACWILLSDRESEQAQLHLQLYGVLVQGLM